MNEEKAPHPKRRERGAKFTVKSYAVGVSDISFRLPTHDWEKFEESELWGQVCRFLEEVQKGYSPMYP